MVWGLYGKRKIAGSWRSESLRSNLTHKCSSHNNFYFWWNISIPVKVLIHQYELERKRLHDASAKVSDRHTDTYRVFTILRPLRGGGECNYWMKYTNRSLPHNFICNYVILTYINAIFIVHFSIHSPVTMLYHIQCNIILHPDFKWID